jgi:hypothetical protein
LQRVLHRSFASGGFVNFVAGKLSIGWRENIDTS